MSFLLWGMRFKELMYKNHQRVINQFQEAKVINNSC